MKKFVTLLFSGVLFFGQVHLFAENDSRMKGDHQLHAVSYEEHIRKLNGTIEIHDQMKKDYENYLKNGEDIDEKRIKKMIKHCETLIKDSREMRDDLLKFTQKHKKKFEESLK